jgi:flagellar hook-associated protein 3 FlgL
MIPPVNATTEIFLANLSRITDRMQRAQQQLSSGKRVNTVSDDPTVITYLLQARASLGAVQQIDMNLGRVKAEVDSSEQGLETAVNIMQRVQVLGTQGATGTQTAASRQALASEAGSLLTQLGGISSTNVEGRYVFSGDSDQTPPYNIDITQANAIGSYSGSNATRKIQHPNGSLFSVSHTAQEIFDAADPTQNVFHSVDDLRIALQNNDVPGINAALSKVTTASSYLNLQLAFYGSAQNNVASATDSGSKLETQLKSEASTFEDADMTSAIVEFQQAQTQQQAALTIQSKMPRTSLFDFLG